MANRDAVMLQATVARGNQYRGWTSLCLGGRFREGNDDDGTPPWIIVKPPWETTTTGRFPCCSELERGCNVAM